MRTATLSMALCLGACASAQTAKTMPDANLRPEAQRLTDADERFLKDLAETRNFSLGRPSRAEIAPDGSRVFFLRSEPRKARNHLFAMDVATGKVEELLTPEQVAGGQPEQLSAEERARRERMRVSGGGFTAYQLSRDGRTVVTSLSGKIFAVDVATKNAVLVAGPDAEGHAPFDSHLSPDGTQVAYVRGGELWVAPITGGDSKQLTSGATDLISHAQAEFVAQEEMGRFTGHFWSGDGKKLVYQSTDNGDVEELRVVDPINLFGKYQTQRYPRPGKNNAKVKLGVVPAAGGDTVWINWDTDKYPYLARVNWFKDSPLTIQVQSRDQKELSLLAVDPTNGATRELVHEHDDAWINLSNEYTWLRDGSGFLWPTERNGTWQLELRAATGQLIRALTPVEMGFRHVRWLDPAGRTIIVSAGKEPIEQQLYELPLDGGAARELTRGPGYHDGHFAREARTYLHSVARPDAPGLDEVVRPDGTVAGQLPSVAEPAPFAARVTLAKVGAAPGYWTALVRPRDFDAKRKYPVWLAVYGGPGHNVVVPAQEAYLQDQWIADHGYLVVHIDNRGTQWRGRAWERAIQNKFAEVPLEDQVAGLQALAAGEPSLDLTRVGVTGGSFGGFLSACAVLRRPDAFKAAVATSSVTDWLDYDTHYTERYLGVPKDAKDDVYTKNGLIGYAPNLSRALLLVHGTADDNVLFSHTLKLADALFRSGKDFELLTLGHTTHMVGAGDPNVRLQYFRRVFEFFRKNL
jgi:dipeptidyl-peptidase-4